MLRASWIVLGLLASQTAPAAAHRAAREVVVRETCDSLRCVYRDRRGSKVAVATKSDTGRVRVRLPADTFTVRRLSDGTARIEKARQ